MSKSEAYKNGWLSHKDGHDMALNPTTALHKNTPTMNGPVVGVRDFQCENRGTTHTI